MINAGQFAKPCWRDPMAAETPFFRFGLSGKDECAAELRRLADAVERGDYLLQRVQTGYLVRISEFAMQAIMIEFAELEHAKPADAADKELMGFGQFPVAIAKSETTT